MNRPGSSVDRVVNEGQSPFFRNRIAGRRGLNSQSRARHEALDGSQILLGNREINIDRRNLVDHDQNREVVRLDRGSRIDELRSGHTANGSGYRAVGKLYLFRLDGGFI